MKKLTFILLCCFVLVSLAAAAQSDTTKTFRFTIKAQGGDKNNNALIVIDGNKQYVGGAEVLKQINPENIQSIQILKADAGIAQYGADGAEGVILITTKSGKLGANNIQIAHDNIIRVDLKNTIDPKQNGTVIIRGQNIGKNNPLYILDGNVVEKTAVNLIDANTISTINILKGNSTTTLYGNNCTNDVILITTKTQSKFKN